MINFYKKMIIRGLKKWTDVPRLWNEAVQKALETDGYTLNDDGTATK